MSELVSIVMPARNAARYLHESIDSILAQTFPHFELIIIDDASTDNTAEVLQDYHDERIVVKRNLTKLGPAHSRNAGIRAASGRYIACMDADDVALPRRLEIQVEFLRSNPDIALVGSVATIIDASGKPIGMHQPPINPEEIRRMLPKMNCLVQSTVMMKAEALRKVGDYRFPLAEDYDLWLRLSEHYGLANLAEPLVLYRSHGGQTSVHQMEELALWAIAARCSARGRRESARDPMVGVEKVTPEFLRSLGAGEAEINTALVESFLLQLELLVADCRGGFEFAMPTDNLRRSSLDKDSKKQIALKLLALAGEAYGRERQAVSSSLIKLALTFDRGLLANKRLLRLAAKLGLGERNTEFVRSLKRIVTPSESSTA